MEQLRNIHPGEVLMEEFLNPYGLSQTQAAKDMGVLLGGSMRLYSVKDRLPLIHLLGCQAPSISRTCSWISRMVNYTAPGLEMG